MRCSWMNHVVRPSALAAVLSLLLIAAIGAAIAAGFVGQTVKILGQVSVNRDGADMTVGPGTALQLGDVIKTGPGARLRLRFVDGSILTLGENTQLSIDIFAQDGTNRSRTVVLTLLAGVVNAAASKSGEDKFDYQIKTATGYSAVRGTKWIVGTMQGVMGVYVLNGQVELGNGAAKPVLIPAGSWSSIDAQGKITPTAVITPDMMKVLLDATSDSGGGTAPSAPTITPTVPTTPAPTQMPSLPLPDDQNPTYQRALKNNNKGGGMKSDHDHYSGN